MPQKSNCHKDSMQQIPMRILLIGTLFFHLCNAYTQVVGIGINITGNAPNSSSVLDLDVSDALFTTKKGLLPPRLTNAQIAAIPSPATGLLVYNTDAAALHYYNGTGWQSIVLCTSAPGNTDPAPTSIGVAVNTTGALAHHSAVLDVDAAPGNNKGMLIPRTTSAAITTPVEGMIIYNTGTNVFNYYNGSSWQALFATSTAITPGGVVPAVAGVAINIDGTSPVASALLDISATYSGLLLPRISSIQRDAIPYPANGLIIYNTTTKLIDLFNGAWYAVVDGPPTEGTHVPSQTQIVWNWSSVTGASGYQWNTTTSYPGVGVNVVASPTYTQTTGLTCGTPNNKLYVWAYNSCGYSTATELTQSTTACCTPTVTDADGNTYNTVLIGNQCWMKENLKTGTFVNVVAGGQTDNSVIQKYCTNLNGQNDNTCPLGGLYEWGEAVQYLNGASNSTSPSPPFSGNVRGVCPTGWHLPTDAEWSIMENIVDAGTGNVGGKMKVTPICGSLPCWNTPNNGASNSSNFTALPGNYSFNGSFFAADGTTGSWQTSTEFSNTNAWYRSTTYSTNNLTRSNNGKNTGKSVRCLMD